MKIPDTYVVSYKASRASILRTSYLGGSSSSSSNDTRTLKPSRRRSSVSNEMAAQMDDFHGKELERRTCIANSSASIACVAEDDLISSGNSSLRGRKRSFLDFSRSDRRRASVLTVVRIVQNGS